MATVKELIRTEKTGGISFGDFLLKEKTKVSDFAYEGDLYKVKTFQEMTKLERNDMFVFESVPGCAVFGLVMKEDGMEFAVSGIENTQITVELEADSEYKVLLNEVSVDCMKTNLGGKLSFSVDLDEEKTVQVKIQKA